MKKVMSFVKMGKSMH